MSTEPLKELGEKVKAARISQRYSVKSAAIAAKIARDTWKRVEAGQSVHDTSRVAALELLGLDWNGNPINDAPAAPDPTDWAEQARLLLMEKRELERENAELRARANETA